MLSGYILEFLVSNYLSSAAKDWLVQRALHPFDFVIDKDDGQTVAIKVLATPPSSRRLKQLRNAVIRFQGAPFELLVVSETSPPRIAAERFQAMLEGARVTHRWIGINELPNALGLESPGDMLAPSTIEHLQLQALVKNLQQYKHAPIGATPKGIPPGNDNYTPELSENGVSLARQLPFGVISRLCGSPGGLEEKLRFGEKIASVTVVISDLKNFSSLVNASRPEDLNEMMAKYYRRSRDAVFKHGGMLDKFIGDAVLAVFGYPEASPHASVNAIKFARELIEIGGSLLDEWKAELNAVIDSGTRVGITTGDIWPLNIGQQNVEITLLGDTINLAARLEKKCTVDGILLDNRTRTKAAIADPSLVSSLKLEQAQISAGDAKGQSFDIRAWRVGQS